MRSAQAREARGSCRGAEPDRGERSRGGGCESDGRGPRGVHAARSPPDLYHAGAFVILNSYRGAGSGSQGRSPHACTKWRVRVTRANDVGAFRAAG